MKTDFQRWTAKRKVELILRIMKGETTFIDICREQDLKQSEVEGWIDSFLKAGESALKTNTRGDQGQHEREIKDLRAKVGELVLELDARKKWQALSQDPASLRPVALVGPA